MYFHIDLQLGFFPVLMWDSELINNWIKTHLDICNLNM